ncbi:MAG: HEPN domain-containing protein [Sphingobium sp.]|nr:HEPN domain-containing protein [Sphingobium sp.]
MMRTDLDHLPYAVTQELGVATNILFEEFAEALKGKLSPHRKAGRILKLILFGAFADPAWCEREADAATVPFDILVIVNHGELTKPQRYWRFAIDRLHRAWQAGVIRRPVRLTVHSLAEVNRALSGGIRFFTAIAEGGIILYQSCDKPLATPRLLSAVEGRDHAIRTAEKWLPKARAFVLGAHFYRDQGNLPMAALMLHQACERLYHCVLWTLTLHSRRTHALDELRDFAEQQDERLRDIWTGETRFERRVFSRIRRAYVEARYSDHFRITADELTWALGRVDVLARRVIWVCADHLASLEREIDPSASDTPSTAIAIPDVTENPDLPRRNWSIESRARLPRFRWNRLIPDRTFWQLEWFARWSDRTLDIVMALLLMILSAEVVMLRMYPPSAQTSRATPADLSAVLDFDIRADTVLGAVGGIANRAGYQIKANEDIWAVRWTGAYRAKATTFDALADVLYGSGLCPAIRGDTIMVRYCAKTHPAKVLKIEYQTQPGSSVRLVSPP